MAVYGVLCVLVLKYNIFINYAHNNSESENKYNELVPKGNKLQ